MSRKICHYLLMFLASFIALNNHNDIAAKQFSYNSIALNSA